VYKTGITDLDELKQRLRTEWAKLDHVVIATDIHQWSRRLSTCVKTGHCIVSVSDFWQMSTK